MCTQSFLILILEHVFTQNFTHLEISSSTPLLWCHGKNICSSNPLSIGLIYCSFKEQLVITSLLDT